MPEKTAVLSFVGGMLVANSSPHLATAVTRREHLTPLAGRRSSPGANLVWGGANLLGGLALTRGVATGGRRWDRTLVAFEAGCLTFAVWMAVTERLVPVNHRV